MKTVVVYFSKFGNTKLVAEAIAEGLDENGTVKVLNAEAMVARELEDADLVVMGTPTHKMNLPESVEPIFDQLPKRLLKGKKVAAFDTSYKMSWFLNRFTAAKRLSGKLRKLGGKQVVSPETFIVEGKEGPLYEGELERAGDWARAILEEAI